MTSTALPAQPFGLRDRTRSIEEASLSPAPRERLRMNSNSKETSRSPAPPLPRRRSSFLSYNSLDDTRHSVTSSAGDFIRPSLGIYDHPGHESGTSHWHSSPLIFALLPALGGLFFKDGSAFLTDVLLLGLAAIFLNWSVRLPWDWYHSAQATHPLPSRRSSVVLEDISEEESSQDTTDKPLDNPEDHNVKEVKQDKSREDKEKDEAARKLRVHETLALVSTIMFPAIGAYLLHVIRGQLSRPSSGLVSDYNLSIFLLAAEIRPFRQLIRLTTARTLHLQRIATGLESPARSTDDGKQVELVSRLEALEAKIGDQMSSVVASPQKDDLTSLQSEMKKRYEPRLDALERAVRRYEKRATTLTLLTEQRLQSLESRLQDALSLAAVAAKSSQQPGLIAMALKWLSWLMMLPLEMVWFLTVWPTQLVREISHRIVDKVHGSSSRTKRNMDSTTSRPKVEKSYPPRKG